MPVNCALHVVLASLAHAYDAFLLASSHSHWLLVLIAASAAAVEEAYVPLTGYDTTYTITAPGGHDVAVFVKKGDTVKVHATGIVEESGKKFWSTKDPGQQPFQYQAGVGGVIVGWDQGCLGMKLGETRKLRIPAHEGYGKGGFPGVLAACRLALSSGC